MKNIHPLYRAILLIAAIMIAFPFGKAAAASYTFGNGDLLLGFHRGDQDVVIDLGAATSSTFVPNNYSLDFGSASPVSSILNTAFGTGWAADSTISVAVFGGLQDTDPVSGHSTNQQVWQSTTAANFSDNPPLGYEVGQVVNDVNGVYGLYNAGGITSTNYTSGGNTYGAISYSTSVQGANAWWNLDQNGWGGEQYGIAVGLNGTSLTSLEVHYITPLVDTKIGSISISTAGVISIQAAAVPEPSTYALLAMGVVASLFLARRRPAYPSVPSVLPS